MHPFQHLKIMCMVAAGALDKQGNMSLIKISFISLLIKRLSLVIQCLCPSPLGLSLLPCAFCFFRSLCIAKDKKVGASDISIVQCEYNQCKEEDVGMWNYK